MATFQDFQRDLRLCVLLWVEKKERIVRKQLLP